MQTTLERPRQVTQYEFRSVNADGLACYDEVIVEANYLADRPKAASSVHPKPYPRCNGCRCLCDHRERHWFWTHRCNNCGVRRMEELIMRIAERHGKGKALAKLAALVNVD
jgi:hypothetical protein